MSADTFTVNTRHNDRHRMKRIKVEGAKSRDTAMAEVFGVDQPPQHGQAGKSTTDAFEIKATDGNYMTTQNAINGDSLGAHIMDTNTSESALSSTQHKSQSLVSPSNHLPGAEGPTAEAKSVSTAPDIDFSSAPSDPIELAWWVAQQIIHFHSDVPASAKVENPEYPLQHSSQLHEKDICQADVDLDLRQTGERAKLRSENRERKRKWRESNVEKSMFSMLLPYLFDYGSNVRPV